MSESHEGLSAGNRPAAARPVERLLLIDALKGIAAQIILLHHLVSYGPLAAAANRLLPALSLWFFEYGRMAVQVFLVTAGFLAARGLAADGTPAAMSPLSLIWRRYVRLALPFIVAMFIALGAALFAGRWMDDAAVPEVLDLGQLVAHGLLLHGVLDVPSLSAGVWYVAIDLQLYALLVLILFFAHHAGGHHSKMLAFFLVAMLGCAALFSFNVDSSLDNWGIYFFGSYSLGAFAWWLADRRQPLYWLVLMLVVVTLALFVEFRLRIALALSVALLLVVAQRQGWLARWPRSRLLEFLGRISFSVFLLHFPVILLISALYVRLGGGSNFSVLIAAFATWGFSIAAGALFFRHVESRKRWLPPALVASFSLRR